jgi:uncharacterized transporter YbjL
MEIVTMSQTWSYRHGVLVFFAVVGVQSGGSTLFPLLRGDEPPVFSVGMFTAVCMLAVILLVSKAIMWMTRKREEPPESTTIEDGQ